MEDQSSAVKACLVQRCSMYSAFAAEGVIYWGCLVLIKTMRQLCAYGHECVCSQGLRRLLLLSCFCTAETATMLVTVLFCLAKQLATSSVHLLLRQCNACAPLRRISFPAGPVFICLAFGLIGPCHKRRPKTRPSCPLRHAFGSASPHVCGIRSTHGSSLALKSQFFAKPVALLSEPGTRALDGMQKRHRQMQN